MSEKALQSAVELAASIREGAVTAVETAEMYLDRIARLDGDLRAVVYLDDRLLERAAAADERLRSGGPIPPFHGVPILVKDVQDVEGQPNTKSSFAVSDVPKSQSDIFVERLLAAGFIPMGRSASSELAASFTTESLKHGVTRNPWHPEVSPSGSSGGAAAAIAAGLTPAATATDGGGSIRLPAAATGLVGLKPGRGLLPQRIPNWEGSSVDGFVTRTVSDTAALLDVTALGDPRAWFPSSTRTPGYSRSLNQRSRALTIGVLREAPTDVPVHTDLLAATDDVVHQLRAAGHRTVPVGPEIVADRGAYRLHRELVGPAGSHLVDYDLSQPVQENVRLRLDLVNQMTVRDYVRAVAEIKRIVREQIEPWFTRFDVLVTPTTAALTPAHGEVIREMINPDSGGRVIEGVTAFAPWVNVLGLPAISLPTHRDSRGLPIGIQLIGGPLSESLLLQIAARLEETYRWHDRVPTWLADGLEPRAMSKSPLS